MRRGSDERGSMTEYALIAIVIGITALFVLGRYGRTVGNRYSSATQHVEQVQPGQGITSDTSAPQEPALPEGERKTDPVRAYGQESGGPQKVGVGGVQFDLSTVIWLGIAVLVVGTAMMVRIFKAAAKKEEDEQ